MADKQRFVFIFHVYGSDGLYVTRVVTFSVQQYAGGSAYLAYDSTSLLRFLRSVVRQHAAFPTVNVSLRSTAHNWDTTQLVVDSTA